MSIIRLRSGVAHTIPADVRTALSALPTLAETWNSLTPLGRNEWLCWIMSAKLIETRQRRLTRTIEELKSGERRPCCWPGCIHREKNSHKK